MSPIQQTLRNVGTEFTDFCLHFSNTLQKDYEESKKDMPFAVFCFAQFVLTLEHIEKDTPQYLPKF